MLLTTHVVTGCCRIVLVFWSEVSPLIIIHNCLFRIQVVNALTQHIEFETLRLDPELAGLKHTAVNVVATFLRTHIRHKFGRSRRLVQAHFASHVPIPIVLLWTASKISELICRIRQAQHEAESWYFYSLVLGIGAEMSLNHQF